MLIATPADALHFLSQIQSLPKSIDREALNRVVDQAQISPELKLKQSQNLPAALHSIFNDLIYDYALAFDQQRVSTLLQLGLRVPADTILKLITHSQVIAQIRSAPDFKAPILETLSLLAQHGADVNHIEIPKPLERSGNTSIEAHSLLISVKNHMHFPELVEHLFSLGANLDQCSEDFKKEFYKQSLLSGVIYASLYCKEQGICLKGGYTPLCLACYTPNAPLFSALLLAGEDPDQPSYFYDDQSPYHSSLLGAIPMDELFSIDFILGEILGNASTAHLAHITLQKLEALRSFRESEVLNAAAEPAPSQVHSSRKHTPL